jgi:hypothetical protein
VRLADEQLPPQVPEPAHAVREPCGAPLVIAEQVPTDPDTSQASHCPPQAPSQHTPSTQRLLWHWPLLEHASPLGRVTTQLPLTQYGALATQSALPAQLLRQAVPALLHTRASPHGLLLAIGQ